MFANLKLHLFNTIKLLGMAWVFIGLNSCKYDPSQNQEQFLVVATTGMIGDALHNMLPNNFNVQTLMEPGVDPHLYEAKPSDIRYLSRAEAVVYNGLHLEGKMAELFDKLKNEKTVVAISDGIEEKHLISLGEHSHDSHIWLGPFIWIEGLRATAEKMAIAYPEFEVEIKANADKYLTQLTAQAEKMKIELATIPKDRRVLITSHDAFNYFGIAFDVRVEALQGISTVAEPGIRKVEQLSKFILEKKIPSVFVESSVSSKSMLALRQACKRANYEIKEGGVLYSDAMGDEKSGAETYLKMLQKNTETILSGLK